MSTCIQTSFLNLWGNTIEALADLSIYGFLTISFITDGRGKGRVKKKSYGIFHNIGRPSPPFKVMEYLFYLFYVWVLKSVLMQRNFFILLLATKFKI